MRKLLVALAVFLVLLLVVDRVAIVVATHQVDKRIESELGGRAQTSVRGFPFLPSAVRRTLPEVTIRAQQTRLSRAELEVHEVDFTLEQVLVRSTSSVRARTLQGSFLVPFAEVQRRSGLAKGSISGGDDGLLRSRKQAQVPQNPIVPSGTQNVVLLSRPLVSTTESMVRVQLVPEAVEIEGQQVAVSNSWAAKLAQTLTFQVGLDNLPRGMQLQQVLVTKAGLLVQVTGVDMPLTGW